MRTLTLLAPAKINLSLDVVGRRSDGYHLLRTVMQSVSLCDRVTVREEAPGTGIRLECSDGSLPTDCRNTAYRAAQGFLAAARRDPSRDAPGLSIRIGKAIPAEAGLAGGSSDAAAVLTGLSRLYPGEVPLRRIPELAVAVGADVPFCLFGGTALCEGIGEIVTPLPPLTGHPLLLLNPGFGIPTPAAFRTFDDQAEPRHPDTEAVCDAVRRRDLSALARTARNVLEPIALAAHPRLADALDWLMARGAPLVRMSGSGPTLFALFPDTEDGLRMREDAAAAAEAEARFRGFAVLRARTRESGPTLEA